MLAQNCKPIRQNLVVLKCMINKFTSRSCFIGIWSSSKVCTKLIRYWWRKFVLLPLELKTLDSRLSVDNQNWSNHWHDKRIAKWSYVTWSNWQSGQISTQVSHFFDTCSVTLIWYFWVLHSLDICGCHTYLTVHWIKACCIWSKQNLFCLWTFLASFFIVVAPFIIEIDSMKKIFQIPPRSGFSAMIIHTG